MFTIPFAYLKTRVNKYDKIVKLIDKVSQIVLFRLSQNFLVTQNEIETVLRNQLLDAGFKSNSVSINNILDSLTSRIEENPFIDVTQRRKILERLITLRKERESTWLNYYRLLKNYQVTIITVLLIVIALVTLVTSDKWKIFDSGGLQFETIAEIGIGLVIAFILFVIFYFLNKIFNGQIFWGEPNFIFTSFNYLPNYLDEKLTLENNSDILELNLVDVRFDSQKKDVETDPGCFGMGIVRMHKLLKSYSLDFVSSTDLSLSISLKKGSSVNGSIDYDYVEYQVQKEDIASLSKIVVHVPDNELINSEIYTDFKLTQVAEEEFLLATTDDEVGIVLTKNKMFYGLKIKDQIWKLKNI